MTRLFVAALSSIPAAAVLVEALKLTLYTAARLHGVTA